MRNTVIFSLSAFASLVASTGNPLLGYDPATAKDCVEWYNNSEGETCEYVRNYFGITPEEFHKWNPSVGLDCTPWYWQSYCIVTQERLNKTATATTSSSRLATSTTSAASLGPSPTAWSAMGCYVENPALPILEKYMSPVGGDASLTIPKCKLSCYRRSSLFAGVQEGNQCWCGSYIGGEWTKNQTDCNTPCTGDKTTQCGGKGLLNIFKALENQVASTTSLASTTTTRASSTGIVKTSATRAAAVKPRALFGMDY